MTDTDMDIDLDLDAVLEKELTATDVNIEGLTDIDADLEAELLGEHIEEQKQQQQEIQVQNTATTPNQQPEASQPNTETTSSIQENDDKEAQAYYDQQFEALPRRTAIFLHGVDNLSTDEIKGYVNSPLLVKVEWINDSSCNLVCNTAEDATALAQTLLQNESQIETLDHRTLVPAKPFILKRSEETQPSREDPLSIRIATDEDIKERGARHKSRYYMLHGVDGQPLSKDRQEARRSHLDRMTQNGGDGRDVFSRLGQRSETTTATHRTRQHRQSHQQRSRSRSPTRQTTRTTITRRHKGPNMEVMSSGNGRKREIQIPKTLLSRLGPLKQKENSQEASKDQN